MAVLSPGPAVAAVVARAMATGLRRSAPFIAGIVAGDLVWFGMAAFGLAALAERFQTAFLLVKYAGAAYLLYLAWKLWTAPVDAVEPSRSTTGQGARLFLGGLVLPLGNPKVMVFFVSILPLVVDMADLDAGTALTVAGVIVVILSTAMWGYSFAAVRARRLIASPGAVRLVNRGGAVAMAGAAAAVATRS